MKKDRGNVRWLIDWLIESSLEDKYIISETLLPSEELLASIMSAYRGAENNGRWKTT